MKKQIFVLLRDILSLRYIEMLIINNPLSIGNTCHYFFRLYLGFFCSLRNIFVNVHVLLLDTTHTNTELYTTDLRDNQTEVSPICSSLFQR